MKIHEPDHDALQSWLQANIANAVKAERERWRRVLERLLGGGEVPGGEAANGS